MSGEVNDGVCCRRNGVYVRVTSRLGGVVIALTLFQIVEELLPLLLNFFSGRFFEVVAGFFQGKVFYRQILVFQGRCVLILP